MLLGELSLGEKLKQFQAKKNKQVAAWWEKYLVCNCQYFWNLIVWPEHLRNLRSSPITTKNSFVKTLINTIVYLFFHGNDFVVNQTNHYFPLEVIRFILWRELMDYCFAVVTSYVIDGEKPTVRRFQKWKVIDSLRTSEEDSRGRLQATLHSIIIK